MTGTGADCVLLDQRDGYAIVTINRPHKRNAVDHRTQTRLIERVDEAHEGGARVVVLTGAGDVSFCAGADLSDTLYPRPTAHEPSPWMGVQRRLADHPAVIIAAVNGYALGGGLTLVNNADLAVASTTATFGIPELNYGIYGALAGPSTVQRIAQKHVAQLVLTADPVDAREALRMGLINEVVEPTRVLPRAEELAARISSFDSLALQVAKASIRAEQHMSWNDALMHGSWSTSFLHAHAAQGASAT